MGIDLKTFTMQIIDCDPEGIKICRVQGSTLVTVVAPRRLLPRLKELPDIPTRGVYYLLQLEHGRLRRVYAGKTTNGILRLDGHNSQKDWWDTAVMFLMPENEMSADVADGLEAAAIKYVRSHDGYAADNSVTPSPYVNPYNESYIDDLHREVLFRMKVLGYNLDCAKSDIVVTPEDAVFHTERRGVRGLGRYIAADGSFEVLAGSQVSMDVPIYGNKGATKLRKTLLRSGGIVRKDGAYVMQVSHSFKSPSAAACFVLGKSQNGWIAWVDAQGRTLDELYPRKRGDATR